MSDNLPGLLCGMVVLSATHRVPLPLVSQNEFSDHIPGVVFQGRSSSIAPFHHADSSLGGRKLFANHKIEYAESILHRLGASGPADNDFRTSFTNRVDKLSSPGDVVVLDQSVPFGLVGLFSKEGGLRLFGVYSEVCSLLLWANTPDIEKLVNSSGSRTWRVMRFKEHSSFSTVVFTMRVCARWHRWSTQSSAMTTEQKFQALEASLLGSDTWMTSS